MQNRTGSLITSDGAILILDGRRMGEVNCHLSLWQKGEKNGGTGWFAGEPSQLDAFAKAKKIELLFGADRIAIELYLDGSTDFKFVGDIPGRVIERWVKTAG